MGVDSVIECSSASQLGEAVARGEVMPKWQTLGLCFAGMVVLVLASPFVALAEADPEDQTAITNRRLPEVRHVPDKEYPDHDKPSPPVKIVIPRIAPPEEIDMRAPKPPDEPQADQPPEIQPDPEVAETGDASFFGVPLSGDFVFVLDLTGSMNMQYNGGAVQDHNGNAIVGPTRVQKLRAEMIMALNQMGSADRFAIVTHGGVPDEVVADEKLMEANRDNKQAAQRRVVHMRAHGALGAYPALKKACQSYGIELNQLIFLTDGGANNGGTNADILRDFPGWYKENKTNGCQLVCIQIGGNRNDREFLSSLANANGGTYLMGGG